MKTQILALNAHGVTSKIVGSHLLVLEEYTINGVYGSKWLDATKWSMKDVFSFLNY